MFARVFDVFNAFVNTVFVNSRNHSCLLEFLQ